MGQALVLPQHHLRQWAAISTCLVELQTKVPEDYAKFFLRIFPSSLREGSFEALVPGVQQGPGASHLVSAASVRVVEVVDYLELDHPGELVRESFSATIYLQ